MARRLADALGGAALNLVVDSDAPRDVTLAVPGMHDCEPVVRRVPFTSIPHGFAYEQIPRLDGAAFESFAGELREAMASRYEQSMLPMFLKGFAASDAADWVDQAIAGRRVTEASLGVSMVDQRVSRVWCSPLLIDMLEHARRFAAYYNNALHRYRERHRVRGAERPIPDLHIDEDRCELPAWVYRHEDVRRRLFVQREGDLLRLFADETPVGETQVSALSCSDRGSAFVGGLDGWLLRPRALALTLWARLLLADLFIHGIGGAKYDRITDEIIRTYYEIEPPRMACVSATLHIGLPGAEDVAPSVPGALQAVRDARLNPQRHIEASPRAKPLLEARAAAVERATGLRREEPRNHRARRDAFNAIRDANAALLEAFPSVLARAGESVRHARRAEARASVARHREYFFALYSRDRLQTLLNALPGERDFRL